MRDWKSGPHEKSGDHMNKYDAIAVLEIRHYAVAMEVLDKVCKSSGVQFLTSEKTLGGRLVSLIVSGSVSEVNEAIETARRVCENKPNNPLKMAVNITNPHAEILKFIVPMGRERLEQTENLEASIELVQEEGKRKRKTNKKSTKN